MALEGPTVLTSSTEVLDAPEQAAALGLTRQSKPRTSAAEHSTWD